MEEPLHIAMFVDQHPGTLGGMQTSVRLQRSFLEAAGHVVTVVAPATRARHHEPESTVELPSLPLGGEYSYCLPGRRNDRALESRLAGRPPLDIVHIQADFWLAATGYRHAARHGLPVVHTMHNRMDVGLAATVAIPNTVQRALGLLQKRLLRLDGPAATDAWSYLRGFTRAADAVTAPSTHFARLLEERGVFAAVDVVPNGLDDNVARDLLATPRPRGSGRVRLVWIGRFSPEKRLLPFLEALRRSGVDAEVHVFGDGAERGKAEAAARRIDRAEVVFRGTVPYRGMLEELRAADALIQTSQGFETQGMTVFEAAALGTPTLLSDHRIAVDLPEGTYRLTPDDTVDGLAAALRAVVGEIRGGAPAVAMDAASLLQSRHTRTMLDVYARTLTAKPAR
ncbi:glycosyltransferase [Arthrobacter halodurans]|uniref:D-inositol 3-phosphate glycosyltransferase n=1 Tax=Arthrobacter halodurans TaxID=516699 RepID=A0ABV4UNG5_9MICC